MGLVPAGRDAAGVQPGDIIAVDRRGPVRDTIRLGQWLNPALRPWAAITHIACVRDRDGTLVEAVFPRVRVAHLSEYRAQSYVHVATGLNENDQAQAIAYLDSRVGDRYGVLTCAGIGVRMLTPGHGGLYLLGGGRTGICSGLAAEMLERGPYIFSELAAAMCPAELTRDLGVSLTNGLRP